MEDSERDEHQQEWVTIRTFRLEAKASLLAAKLESSGIPTFLADSFTANVFPMGGDGGFRLQVPMLSLEHAQAVLYDFDQSYKENVETNFREATKDDIAYQKELNKNKDKNFSWITGVLVVVIALLLLRVIGRALGIFPEGLDPF